MTQDARADTTRCPRQPEPRAARGRALDVPARVVLGQVQRRRGDQLLGPRITATNARAEYLNRWSDFASLTGIDPALKPIPGQGVAILSDMVHRPWSLEGRRIETLPIRQNRDNLFSFGSVDYALTKDQTLRMTFDFSRFSSDNLGIGQFVEATAGTHHLTLLHQP